MATSEEQRLLKLVFGLIVQTQKDAVSWKESDDEEGFITSARTAAVEISTYESGFHTRYKLTIYDEGGRIIEELDSGGVSESAGPLEALYKVARSNALNVEEVLGGLFDEFGISE